MAPCTSPACGSRQERDAWCGAAILLIPENDLRELRTGAAPPESMAEARGVPMPLIAVRQAVSQGLEARGGQHLRTGHAFDRAFRRWMAWVEGAAASL